MVALPALVIDSFVMSRCEWQGCSRLVAVLADLKLNCEHLKIQEHLLPRLSRNSFACDVGQG